MALLEVRNLSVTFDTPAGPLRVVDGIDLTVDKADLVSIVGESGSGKSLSMLAIMGLIDGPARVSADSLCFDGAELMRLAPRQRRALMGREIAMIFQDPRASLNPCYTVGWQVAEALKIHGIATGSRARDEAIALIAAVGISQPALRYSAYPHELSGGMNQRVMIAMAIACRPRLLIADEPTSALDVTVQNQILGVLANLQREHGMSLVMITHDMGVVERLGGNVRVMYAGKVIEQGATEDVLAAPRHPYTAALLASRPETKTDIGRLFSISGTVPGAGDRPQGCLFSPRCMHVSGICRDVRPHLAGEGSRMAACHFEPARLAAVPLTGEDA